MSLRDNHTGILVKPHGFRGEMLVRGSKNALEKITKGIWLFMDISGQRIPFFVEAFSPEASGTAGIIQFEFIRSDRVARRYAGCRFYDALEADNTGKPSSVRDYIGYEVRDTNSGQTYRVNDYLDHPGNPLLVLEREGKEVLFPANDDFILSFDTRKKVLKVRFPEGLV